MCTHFRMLDSNWFLEIILQSWQSYLIKTTMSILVPLIWFIDSASIFFLFGSFRSGTCLLLDRRPTVLWPIILQRETLRSHSQFSSDSHTYTELWVFKKKLPQNEYKLSMQTTRVDLYAYIYESKLQNFHPSDYCLYL